MTTKQLSLHHVVLTCARYPAIDNHAHPLLSASKRSALPFEGLVSEASGRALDDTVHTLACYRATCELAQLYGIQGDHSREVSWDEIKRVREGMDYQKLCKLCFEPAKIYCLLLDDGLGGVEEMAEGYQWHDQFTLSPTKRIVRVEVVAQVCVLYLVSRPLMWVCDSVFLLIIWVQEILQSLFSSLPGALPSDVVNIFCLELVRRIEQQAQAKDVVGFKSIVCYRTGMNVSTSCTHIELEKALDAVYQAYRSEPTTPIRLAEKVVNDFVVRTTLELAGKYKKPGILVVFSSMHEKAIHHHLVVQFHTGLGDSDITLGLSSPSHLQPIMKGYPNTPIVLLHSSYPYTRDAGYLTAVYKNVYLDFGEIFPFLSRSGQESVVWQMLELAPTNKIMWSSERLCNKIDARPVLTVLKYCCSGRTLVA